MVLMRPKIKASKIFNSPKYVQCRINILIVPKLLVSFIDLALVETRNGFIVNFLISCRCICKFLTVQYNYHLLFSQILFQSKVTWFSRINLH